jgi:hypothetical protein
MALAETLNGGLDPFTSVGKVAKGGDAQTRAGIARQELEPIMRAESDVAKEIAREETRLKREKAQAETLAEETFATGKRESYDKYQAGLEQRPTFNPTEFNAPAAAELAGLTAVIGAIAGAGRARAALKSMEGFTRGHKEGRADLYDKEIKQYEKDIQAWKDNVGMAKEKLTQVIDLLSTDKNAALVKAKELDPILQEGLALAKVRQGNYKGALDDLNNVLKAGDQAEAAFLRTTKEGGLKPGVVATDRFAMRVKLKGVSDRMKKALADEEFGKKLDKYRIDLFFQEQSPYLDQLLQTNIPEDVRAFGILAKTFRNQKYKEESGTAVTSYEQLRQYGAVPQPGDSAKTLKDKLKTLDVGLIGDISTDMTVYPQLRAAGQALGYAPSAVQSVTQKFATKADVDTTAEANNLTVDQTKKLLKEQGYKIEGEE